MSLPDLVVKPIAISTARAIIGEFHYARTSPPINKYALGLWLEDVLKGVVTLGYGTRPLHTIRALFPSLGVGDYLEINRLWTDDDLPKNNESWFLARIIAWAKVQHPDIKLLFSWADGLRGKPGYIYQAANFLYGGFIESEFYVTGEDEVVHPRLVITRYGSRNKEATDKMGLSKLRGRQFRYIYFLCSRKEAKRLLAESPYTWGKNYPKDADCVWWTRAGEGSRESHQLPKLKGTGQFRSPAPLFELIEAMP